MEQIKIDISSFDEMITVQKEFQRLLGNNVKSQYYINEMALGLIDELREIQEEFLFFNSETFTDAVKLEIIDAITFNVNLMLITDIYRTSVSRENLDNFLSINELMARVIKTLMEGIRATSFKSWRKVNHFDEDLFRDKMMEVFYYLIMLGEKVGIKTFDEVYNTFMKKNQINIQRQKDKE